MKWTKKEETLLKKMYSTGSRNEMVKSFLRTWSAIIKKANELGLARGKGEWTEEEVKILKELYPMGEKDVIGKTKKRGHDQR